MPKGSEIVWPAPTAGSNIPFSVQQGCWGRWQWETASLFGFGSPKDRPIDLSGKVEEYQKAEGNLQSRLATANLEHRKKELITLRDDPGFHQLGADKQQFIRQRLDEIQAYQNFRDALAKVDPIADVRSLEALAETKKKLETDAGIPKEYQSEWDKPQNAPDAVVDRRQKLEQIQRLTTAVGELRRFYTTLDNEGKDLIYDAKLDNTWERDVLDSLETRQETSFSEVRSSARCSLRVSQCRIGAAGLASSAGQLATTARVRTGTGNPRGTGKADAPLMLRESNADADINSLAATRLRNLRTLYPNYKSWSLTDLKDTVRPRFLERLKVAYRNTILDGKKLILRRLKEINPTGPESPSDWSKIADSAKIARRSGME